MPGERAHTLPDPGLPPLGLPPLGLPPLGVPASGPSSATPDCPGHAPRGDCGPLLVPGQPQRSTAMIWGTRPLRSEVGLAMPTQSSCVDLTIRH